ncbi:hypothetical protein K3495_g6341 [Podosphaera aphanis]|nr:hypothetical protein K3495_g6341 [Podosphaera aphanis]
MSPLIADPETCTYDILAIQEPWFNRQTSSTHCPSSSPFSLGYEPGHRRSCFLVNRRLDPDTWSISFGSTDVSSLYLNTETGVLAIHNVYCPPVGSYSSRSCPEQLDTLRGVLSSSPSNTQHIVLGDFNFHHPLWSGVYCPTQHLAASHLLDIIDQHGLELLTPPGLITRSFRGQETTIDLAFGTPTVQDKLIRCSTVHRLDHGSDHLPICISVDITPEKLDPVPTRVWKETDSLAANAEAIARFPPPRQILTAADLDAYCDEISQIIGKMVDITVPLRKPSSRAVPWWSNTVRSAIKLARKMRYAAMRIRHPEDFDRARDAARARDRTIREAKTTTFRQAVHDASSQRFYPSTSADLDDIPDKDRLFPRSQFDPCPDPAASFPLTALVTLEDVHQALFSKKAFSAPGWDGVPYHFLRALGDPLAKSLQAIAQACWDLGHYPKCLKRARTVVVRKPGKESYEDPGAWRPIALLPTIGKVIETITAKRLSELAETHKLLPPSQMGNRPKRSTDTALDLLTSQIHQVWGSKKHMASLLFLDIAGAFDTVDPM